MKILFKEELKKHTSFKIGGIADVFVDVESIEELQKLIAFLREKRIKYYIFGNGTNLLVSDLGLRGCVVHIGPKLSKVKINQNIVEVEAGESMGNLANILLENGLSGFETLANIPGTIGGAITMNAGAHKRSISDLVISVDVLDENNNIINLNRNQMNFSYRHSIVEEKKYIVLKAYLQLNEGNKENIKNLMEQYKATRQLKQPIEYASAGSIFKNPENDYASRLIEDSNLKGERVGDAEVSMKHSGFIINLGNATATDVYKLINRVKDRIFTYYNLNLETEIKLLGKFK